MDTKICSKCSQEKDISLFNKGKNQCKCCMAVYRKEYYNNNREECLSRGRKFKSDNKQKLKEYQQNYYLEHSQERLDYNKKWNENNPESIKRTRRKEKEKFQENKNLRDEKNLKASQWRLQNPQRVKEYRKKDAAKVDRKIRVNIANQIRRGIKKFNAAKLESTLTFLGISISEFLRYLESKFLPCMTWENYGKGDDKWNIDHILPCAAFNLSILEEQKICFHYTNLQPLWQVDNKDKNDKITNDLYGREIKNLPLREKLFIINMFKSGEKFENYVSYKS